MTKQTSDDENREKIRYVVLSGLAFGVAMAVVFRFTMGSWTAAWHGGFWSAFLFGFAMHVILKVQMPIVAADRAGFADDEIIAMHGPANHKKGMEAVGGKLFLTSTRLRFKSHAFNFRAHDESFPLDEIESVEPARSIGIIPNAIVVRMRYAGKQRFVVMTRAKWIAAITEKISAAEALRKIR
jgi:hypothetical protein